MHARQFSRIFLLLVTLTVVSSHSMAATIIHRYSIAAPKLIAQSDGFTLLSLADSYQMGKIGEPTLPHIPVRLLLPPGHSARSIEVHFRGRLKLAEAVTLSPRQYPRTEMVPDADQHLNSAVYLSQEIYAIPSPSVETHFFHGHSVALAFFCPVEYIPASGSVSYFSEADVVIETAPDSRAEQALNRFPLTPFAQNALSKRVDNFNHSRRLYSSPVFEPVYDYLIITRKDFLTNYQSLVTFYNQRGIRTRATAVEEIYKSIAGADEQEKIRNYIIQQIATSGISCVLLAGDADMADDILLQVPIRKFYCEVLSGGSIVSEDIPTDLYYSALDGNWNTDGDDAWGEPGEDDLLPEIAVGRICADTADEIAAYLNKIFNYVSRPVVSDSRRMLMAGEKLWDNPLSYGSDYLNLLIGNHDDNGYFTVGMPADLDYIFLYEKTMGPWNGGDIMQRINSGCNIIFHDGHSSMNGNMNLSLADITNENFQACDGAKHLNPVVYSHGCNSAALDLQTFRGGDCIAEAMLEIEKFASAYIGNTRYGWFNEGQTEGPSIHLNREFIGAIYGDSIFTLGAAHASSRFRTAPFVTAPNQWEPGALRWCFYGCNVLGDPAMPLWTNTVSTFNSISYPSEIESIPATVHISADVAGARVALSSNGEVLSTGITGANGNIDLPVSTAPRSATIDLTVTAHNYVPFTGAISSPSTNVLIEQSTTFNFTLNKSYPNPFNMTTTIQFSISKQSDVQLEIFNVMGQRMATLWSGPLNAGNHQRQWDARDAAGNTLPSGIYFIRLNSIEGTRIESCLLLK
ncbi:MAG: C25 family cysteine peptidase [Candidatus Zhuqueibacterota bacterium]